MTPAPIAVSEINDVTIGFLVNLSLSCVEEENVRLFTPYE